MLHIAKPIVSLPMLENLLRTMRNERWNGLKLQYAHYFTHIFPSIRLKYTQIEIEIDEDNDVA